MESPLLPSEIARLVLGYLEEENCDEAAQCFLEHSPHLAECLAVAKQGRKFSTRVLGNSLNDLLDGYCAVHSLVAERLQKLPESSAEQLRQCGGLINQLRFLLDATKSGQTVLVSITVPPQGGTQPSNNVSSILSNRPRSWLQSTSDRTKRTAIRWQQDSKQRSKDKEDRSASSGNVVETTPLESLPGLGLDNRSTQTGREGAVLLPQNSAAKATEETTVSSSGHETLLAVNSSENVQENVVGCVNSGRQMYLSDGEHKYLQEQSHKKSSKNVVVSCKTSTVEKNICSEMQHVESLSPTTSSPRRKSGTTKKKTSTPNHKGPTPSKPKRTHSEETETGEDVRLSLHRALLDNKELQEKIAENINRVRSEVHTSGLQASEPVVECDGMIHELNQAIKTIVDQTQQDPLFEKFLEEILGPVDEEMSPSPAAAESETEDASGMSEALLEDDNHKRSEEQQQEVSPSSDVPLKQRLRSARQNKNSVSPGSSVKEPRKSNCSLDDQNAAAIQYILDAKMNSHEGVRSDHQAVKETLLNITKSVTDKRTSSNCISTTQHNNIVQRTDGSNKQTDSNKTTVVDSCTPNEVANKGEKLTVTDDVIVFDANLTFTDNNTISFSGDLSEAFVLDSSVQKQSNSSVVLSSQTSSESNSAAQQVMMVTIPSSLNSDELCSVSTSQLLPAMSEQEFMALPTVIMCSSDTEPAPYLNVSQQCSARTATAATDNLSTGPTRYKPIAPKMSLPPNTCSSTATIPVHIVTSADLLQPLVLQDVSNSELDTVLSTSNTKKKAASKTSKKPDTETKTNIVKPKLPCKDFLSKPSTSKQGFGSLQYKQTLKRQQSVSVPRKGREEARKADLSGVRTRSQEKGIDKPESEPESEIPTAADSITLYSCETDGGSAKKSTFNQQDISLPHICADASPSYSLGKSPSSVVDLLPSSTSTQDVRETLLGALNLKHAHINVQESDKVECKDNAGEVVSCSKMSSDTPQTISRRSVVNPKRLSLSTPRRRRSHVRALDFGTPPKSGTESAALKRSKTSPKGMVGKQRSPRAMDSATKSLRRATCYKSPLSRCREAKNVRSSLFKSPDPPNSNHITKEVHETPDVVSNESSCPIATRSPAPQLVGGWDKVTGAGLIFGVNSPDYVSENIRGPETTAKLVPKTLFLSPESQPSDTSPQQSNEEENKNKAEQATHSYIRPRDKSSTWDADLRALLNQDYENAAIEPKITERKKTVRKVATKPRKTKKAKYSKVTEEEARKLEAMLNSSGENEEAEGVVPQSEDTNQQDEEKSEQAQESKEVSSTNDGLTSQLNLEEESKEKSTDAPSCSPVEDNHSEVTVTNVESAQTDVDASGKKDVSVVSGEKDVSVVSDEKDVSVVSNEKDVSVVSNEKDVSIVSDEKDVSVASCEKDVSVASGEKDVAVVSGEKDVAVVSGEKDVAVVSGEKDVSVVRDEKNALVVSGEKDVLIVSGEKDAADVNDTTNPNKESTAIAEPEIPGTFTFLSAIAASPTKLTAGKGTFVQTSKPCLLLESEDIEENIETFVISGDVNTASDNDQNESMDEGDTVSISPISNEGKASPKSAEIPNRELISVKPPKVHESHFVLDTPRKINAIAEDLLSLIPLTPRVLSPQHHQEDTPLTKILRDHSTSIDLSMINTPTLPPTPNIVVSPNSADSPLSYTTRATDYSSCSSYYNPSTLLTTPGRDLEQVLIDECSRIEKHDRPRNEEEKQKDGNKQNKIDENAEEKQVDKNENKESDGSEEKSNENEGERQAVERERENSDNRMDIESLDIEKQLEHIHNGTLIPQDLLKDVSSEIQPSTNSGVENDEQNARKVATLSECSAPEDILLSQDKPGAEDVESNKEPDEAQTSGNVEVTDPKSSSCVAHNNSPVILPKFSSDPLPLETPQKNSVKKVDKTPRSKRPSQPKSKMKKLSSSAKSPQEKRGELAKQIMQKTSEELIKNCLDNAHMMLFGNNSSDEEEMTNECDVSSSSSSSSSDSSSSSSSSSSSDSDSSNYSISELSDSEIPRKRYALRCKGVAKSKDIDLEESHKMSSEGKNTSEMEKDTIPKSNLEADTVEIANTLKKLSPIPIFSLHKKDREICQTPKEKVLNSELEEKRLRMVARMKGVDVKQVKNTSSSCYDEGRETNKESRGVLSKIPSNLDVRKPGQSPKKASFVSVEAIAARLLWEKNMQNMSHTLDDSVRQADGEESSSEDFPSLRLSSDNETASSNGSRPTSQHRHRENRDKCVQRNLEKCSTNRGKERSSKVSVAVTSKEQDKAKTKPTEKKSKSNSESGIGKTPAKSKKKKTPVKGTGSKKTVDTDREQEQQVPEEADTNRTFESKEDFFINIKYSGLGPVHNKIVQEDISAYSFQVDIEDRNKEVNLTVSPFHELLNMRSNTETAAPKCSSAKGSPKKKNISPQKNITHGTRSVYYRRQEPGSLKTRTKDKSLSSLKHYSPLQNLYRELVQDKKRGSQQRHERCRNSTEEKHGRKGSDERQIRGSEPEYSLKELVVSSSTEAWQRADRKKMSSVRRNNCLEEGEVSDGCDRWKKNTKMQEPRSTPGPQHEMTDDTLMTYALVGSLREENSCESNSTSSPYDTSLVAVRAQDSDVSVGSFARVVSMNPRGSNDCKEQVTSSTSTTVIASTNDESRSLPPKKRKASTDDIPAQPEKRSRGETPQTLLKAVDLDKFLNVLHGNESS